MLLLVHSVRAGEVISVDASQSRPIPPTLFGVFLEVGVKACVVHL
jgi:hypothetical protein